MLPAGVIAIWSGSIATIPVGWILCDGTAGTPDLRDKFVQGAGGALNPDDTGGASTHLHAFVSDTHTHLFGAGFTIESGTGVNEVTNAVTVPGTTDPASSLPPFYALAYIMKT